MTTIRTDSTRSTDDILGQVMTETNNHDAERAKAGGGKPLHFDAYDSLAAHRDMMRPTTMETALAMGEAGGAKVLGAGVDYGVDKAVGQIGSFAGRGALGAAFQGLGSAMMLHEFYYSHVERSNAEGDKQRELGASDAGVVGLANALPYDDGFKRLVTTSHAGSSNAAAAMKAQLESPAHKPELDALQRRSDEGIVAAAPLARATAKELATLKHEIDANTATAKQLRAQGRAKEAASYDEASKTLMARTTDVQKRYVESFPKAHEDAAFGLGTQYALYHALRSALGTEPANVLDSAVQNARARLVATDPPATPVKG